MSLNLPPTPGHPNKLPFTGILTRVDTPSDNPPGGSNGKRIVLTRMAAQNALPSLLGMAVDYLPSLDGHDPTVKIGVIDSAEIHDTKILISGILYASDFPAAVAYLKSKTGELGFSFEASAVEVTDDQADPLIIESCVFTGAAILRKDKAAYQSTSFSAARAARTMDMKADPHLLTGKLSADSAGDSISTRVAPFVSNLMASATALRKAGIGADPALGHCIIIEALANDLEKSAQAGVLPEKFDVVQWLKNRSSNADCDDDSSEPASSDGDQISSSQVRAKKQTLTEHEESMVLRNLRVAAQPLVRSGKLPMRKTKTGLDASVKQVAGHPIDARMLAALSIEPRSLDEWDRLLADQPVAQRLELKVSLRQRNLIA